MGRSQTDCMEMEASAHIKPHIMGNKASITHHVTAYGHAVTKASQPSTSKREQVKPPHWHVDANCCSNFCAVGLLYRTPNWQEVTSLHKHLLRDAQAFGDMMKVSSRQTLTNRPTIQSHALDRINISYAHTNTNHTYSDTQIHTNAIQC